MSFTIAIALWIYTVIYSLEQFQTLVVKLPPKKELCVTLHMLGKLLQELRAEHLRWSKHSVNIS